MKEVIVTLKKKPNINLSWTDETKTNLYQNDWRVKEKLMSRSISHHVSNMVEAVLCFACAAANGGGSVVFTDEVYRA